MVCCPQGVFSLLTQFLVFITSWSRCLKKYCVCFNAGIECSAGRCKCNNCANPLGRISAAASAGLTSDSALPIKAKEDLKCKCVKTNCLKLYCDCFRQDKQCNSNCGCLECKNTVDESGPTGRRTLARNEILKTRPLIFSVPKKQSGLGCNCTKNK